MAEKTNNSTPVQLDVEFTNIDRAAKAVREFQGGKATHAFTKDQLKQVRPQDLKIVAMATRVPVSVLEELRGTI